MTIFNTNKNTDFVKKFLLLILIKFYVIQLNLFSKSVTLMEGIQPKNNESLGTLKEKSGVELNALLSDNDFEHLTSSERVTFLRTLIMEKAATEEGTNIPIDNSNRFIVEELATLLRYEEVREELEEIEASLPA